MEIRGFATDKGPTVETRDGVPYVPAGHPTTAKIFRCRVFSCRSVVGCSASDRNLVLTINVDQIVSEMDFLCLFVVYVVLISRYIVTYDHVFCGY